LRLGERERERERGGITSVDRPGHRPDGTAASSPAPANDMDDDHRVGRGDEPLGPVERDEDAVFQAWRLGPHLCSWTAAG
jgi:hypothetical protein